jgi:hypothetical protein
MSLDDLSGLASDVETSSIVDRLISIERQANAGLGLRKSNVLASRDRDAETQEYVRRVQASAAKYPAAVASSPPRAATLPASPFDHGTH